MSWINKNWKTLTVVGGILGVSAYASKYFDVEPVDDFEAESSNFVNPRELVDEEKGEYGIMYLRGAPNGEVAKFLHLDCPLNQNLEDIGTSPYFADEGEIHFYEPGSPMGECYTCGKNVKLSDEDFNFMLSWFEDYEGYGAETFGAESTLPRLTPKQMDFLRYSSWAMAYEAYATGKRRRYTPGDWKEDYTICKNITSDGFGNDEIARKTLQSLLEKKVVKATDTSYVRQDGRIRKSYAEQVNENPSLVKNITQICLVLTPIGLEILKRMFARNFKDVVGWKIELTFPSGDTAYLHDVPNDIGKALDSHIGDVKWDSQTERFGAEDFGADDCPSCKNNPGSYDYWGNGPFECYWCKTRGYYDAETDYDDYVDRIFTFINEKVGTEYFPSDEDEEEVARFKKDFNDEFDEVGQAIEDANDWSWNEILGADEGDEAYIRDRYGEPLENMSISRKLESVASSLKDLTSEDMLFTVINNLSTKQANQLINRLYAGIREGSIRRKPFRHNMRMGAEEKRYPRSPNDEILDGLSETDLRTIIFAYGAEIKSMKDREKYLERILKNEGVWYSNPTISDYMKEGMTKSEATSAYYLDRSDELFATISYLLEYASKGGLKVKSFEAESESFESYDYYTIERDDDWEFDEAYMEKQDAERIMKLLKIVRRKATGSNARYAKNYAREAENAYYQYGMKGLKVQVAYVLSNLGGWRGDEAKEVKAELRRLTK